MYISAGTSQLISKTFTTLFETQKNTLKGMEIEDTGFYSATNVAQSAILLS